MYSFVFFRILYDLSYSTRFSRIFSEFDRIRSYSSDSIVFFRILPDRLKFFWILLDSRISPSNFFVFFRILLDFLLFSRIPLDSFGFFLSLFNFFGFFHIHSDSLGSFQTLVRICRILTDSIGVSLIVSDSLGALEFTPIFSYSIGLFRILFRFFWIFFCSTEFYWNLSFLYDSSWFSRILSKYFGYSRVFSNSSRFSRIIFGFCRILFEFFWIFFCSNEFYWNLSFFYDSSSFSRILSLYFGYSRFFRSLQDSLELFSDSLVFFRILPDSSAFLRIL